MRKTAIQSSQKQIANSLKASTQIIKHNLTSKELRILKKVQTQKASSRKAYTKNGKYTLARQRIHNKIMNKYLRQDNRTRSPDIYIFGGIAGSGKTTTLKRYVKERAMTINSDDIKNDLAKYNPSPIKKYPLMHARFLHEESTDIEKKLIIKAIKGRKDIILDKTLANLSKIRRLIRSVRGRGYEVTILGTNLPPHVALLRVASRFLKHGRYVPLKRVALTGNRTNRNVLRIAKNRMVVNARVMYDRNGRQKVLYLKRKGFNKARKKKRRRQHGIIEGMAKVKSFNL